MPESMKIGFIAHDAKKKLMQNCCIAYRQILSKHDLYATGTTGRLIQEASGLPVHKFLEGHVGGEQQMSTMVEQNLLDLVLFFRDPESTISTLGREAQKRTAQEAMDADGSIS